MFLFSTQHLSQDFGSALKRQMDRQILFWNLDFKESSSL
jgi:hypothetical protein